MLLALVRLAIGRAFSTPDWELNDVCLEVAGRPAPTLATVDSRPLNVRALEVLGAVVVEPCRAGLVPGMGGGAMDGRPAVADGRGRPPSAGFALEGVFVRDGTPLEGAGPSCVVGDLVGD